MPNSIEEWQKENCASFAINPMDQETENQKSIQDGREVRCAALTVLREVGASTDSRHLVDFYNYERNKHNTISLYHYVDYRVCSDLVCHAVFIYYFRYMKRIVLDEPTMWFLVGVFATYIGYLILF